MGIDRWVNITYTNQRRFEWSAREEMAMIEYLEILVLGKRTRWKKLMTSLWIFYVILAYTYLEREEEELPVTFKSGSNRMQVDASPL